MVLWTCLRLISLLLKTKDTSAVKSERFVSVQIHSGVKQVVTCCQVLRSYVLYYQRGVELHAHMSSSVPLSLLLWLILCLQTLSDKRIKSSSYLGDVIQTPNSECPLFQYDSDWKTYAISAVIIVKSLAVHRHLFYKVPLITSDIQVAASSIHLTKAVLSVAV